MEEIFCIAWTKKGKKEFTYEQLFEFDDALHRLDGPAVEFANGSKQWWVDGRLLNTKEVEQWLEENNIDLKEIENQMAFKLRFA